MGAAALPEFWAKYPFKALKDSPFCTCNSELVALSGIRFTTAMAAMLQYLRLMPF